MRTLTAEDIQRYVRIAGYWITGWLTSRGVAVEGTWIELIGGPVGGAVLLAWSIYGMRVNAKIIELKKLAQIPETPVAGLVMTNSPEGRALAQLDGPIVTAGSDAARRMAA